MDERSDNELRRRRASSHALCRAVIRTMDRAFVAEGTDEPDLGVNVVYYTARMKLERLASAEVWEVPAATAHAIRTRLASLASLRDPQRLESELLSFPSWVIRSLDRRVAGRPVSGMTPQRRIGDRLPGAGSSWSRPVARA